MGRYNRRARRALNNFRYTPYSLVGRLTGGGGTNQQYLAYIAVLCSCVVGVASRLGIGNLPTNPGPKGPPLVRLRDAGTYIIKVPKDQHDGEAVADRHGLPAGVADNGGRSSRAC
jgi:hypothetical protein